MLIVFTNSPFSSHGETANGAAASAKSELLVTYSCMHINVSIPLSTIHPSSLNIYHAAGFTSFSWGRSKLPISGAPLVWAPLAVVGL